MKTRLLYLETEELGGDDLRAILSSLQLLDAPAGEPAYVVSSNGVGKSASLTATIQKAAQANAEAHERADEALTTMLAGEPQGTPEPRPVIPEPSKPAAKAEPVKSAKRTRRWTPEQRAEQSARMKQARAARKARREAEATATGSTREEGLPAAVLAEWIPEEPAAESEPPAEAPAPIQEAKGVFERIKGSIARRTDGCIEEIVDYVRGGEIVTIDWIRDLVDKYDLPIFQVRDLVEQAQRDARADGVLLKKAKVKA